MSKLENIKIVVITGGVVSGLGKGVLTASIGSFYTETERMVCIKCDGYLNTDPGTMNPIEHGEVFVLNDGGEVDMDFGHYERFMGVSAKKNWNITMGKVYQQILLGEREGRYLGKTVQLIPHATDEIKKQIFSIIKEERATLAFVEVGGTIGDMENELFIESLRQIRSQLGRNDMLFIHLTYVPFIEGSRELKTKPTQASVKTLNQAGIYPDIVIARSPTMLGKKLKEKISLYCNLEPNAVISNVDLENIYYLPKYLEGQNLTEIIQEKLGIKSSGHNAQLQSFLQGVTKLSALEKEKKVTTLRVAIFGKYTKLEDSYASINEALLHAKVHLFLKEKIAIKLEVSFEDTTSLDKLEAKTNKESMDYYDAVIVPGGFGRRGMEGKIEVVRKARKTNVPFLGLCLGMQVAVVEFARNVCNMPGAYSKEYEVEEEDRANNHLQNCAVIDFLPGQQQEKNKGASMRLGSHQVLLKKKSLVHELFQKEIIFERFRHRYEVNEDYVSQIESGGMLFTGITNDNKIKQICEIPQHPFFLCTQSHPELSSTPRSCSPFFYGLLHAAYKKNLQRSS